MIKYICDLSYRVENQNSSLIRRKDHLWESGEWPHCLLKSVAFLGYNLFVPTWSCILVLVAVGRGREVHYVEAVRLGVGLHSAAAAGDARAKDDAGAEIVAASGGAVWPAEMRYLREEE